MVKKQIVVVGGGPAGVAAALAAARSGADVCLLEQQYCLGGMATTGVLGFLGPLDNAERNEADWVRFRLDREGREYPPELDVGARIIRGIPEEIVQRLETQGMAEVPTFGYIPINGEALKLLLEEMVAAAGIEIRYGVTVCAAQRQPAVIRLTLATKGRREDVDAARVVDCSGDGDVAVALGAAFEQGREDGQCQGVTLVFRLGGVTADPLDFLPNSNVAARVRGATAAAVARGELNFDPRGIGCVSVVPGMPGAVTVNHQHTYGIDGTDPQAVTGAIRNGRRQVHELVEYYRRYVPGCEQAWLLETGHCLGVRETRRILGDYVLTRDDVVNGNKFADGICRHAYVLDIHLPDSEGGVRTATPPGDWYEIPYRCLVPRGSDNLLVAGRCISGTHEAMSSYRLMTCCMAIGQAAGTAAAMSLAAGVLPRHLDTEALRSRLRADGALI